MRFSTDSHTAPLARARDLCFDVTSFSFKKEVTKKVNLDGSLQDLPRLCRRASAAG